MHAGVVADEERVTAQRPRLDLEQIQITQCKDGQCYAQEGGGNGGSVARGLGWANNTYSTQYLAGPTNCTVRAKTASAVYKKGGGTEVALRGDWVRGCFAEALKSRSGSAKTASAVEGGRRERKVGG